MKSLKQLARIAERGMGMSDTAWERHANPWSGWTRLVTMPILTLAFWSRLWIGWWSLIPIGIAFAWIWINPRLFPPPKSQESWMSRAVLGERIWLSDAAGAVAKHHGVPIKSTTWIAAVGALVWISGLIWLDPTATLCGLIASVLGKLWFLDRMVWIQRDNCPPSKHY